MICVLALVIFVALPLLATVTFNSNDGSGYAGKGDVMTALGFNGNKTDLSKPVFSYSNKIHYAQSCTKIIETRHETKILEHDFTRVRNIKSALAFDTKITKGNQNVAGYNLVGLGGELNPLPATLCNGEWLPQDELGAPTSIYVVSETGGLLNVSAGGRMSTIWPTLPTKSAWWPCAFDDFGCKLDF
jgi:hypothetical protein